MYARHKISTRQVFFMLFVLTFTPSVRALAPYVAGEAKQAGWVACFTVLFFFLILIYAIHRIVSKYRKENFVEIACDILGRVLGRALTLAYIIWFTLVGGIYFRIFADRMLSSVYPSTDIAMFLLTMTLLLALTLKRGIVPVARMGELLFPILLGVFIFICITILPRIKLTNLLPISYLDILPILKGSFKVLAINAYAVILLLFSGIINDKENTARLGLKAGLFLAVAQTTLVAVIFTSVGLTIALKSSYTFLMAAKDISLFNIIERVESLILAVWVISDFILLAVFIYAVLHLSKHLFGLSGEKPLLNVYLVLFSALGFYVCRSIFRMEELLESTILPGNLILLYVMPLFLFTVAKVRGKI